MTIEVQVDNEVFGFSEEKKWLETEILVGNGNLILHSNEIGDEVGVIKKVSNITFFPDSGPNVQECDATKLLKDQEDG